MRATGISPRMSIVTGLGLGLGFCLNLGCGPVDPSEESNGSAPVLSNLQIQPDVISVGQPATMTISFEFQDADRDGRVVGGTVELPDQTMGQVPAYEPDNVYGELDGVVRLMLGNLTAPAAGLVLFELWMEDDRLNRSNRLTGTIEVE